LLMKIIHASRSTSPRGFALAVAVSLLAAGAVDAEVLPAGIINSPPTIILGGRAIDSDTTLNVLDGGVVGSNFEAGLGDGSSTNVVVNISGGTVAGSFVGRPGSVVNISGGAVGNSSAFYGQLNLSGGVLGTGFNAVLGSSINITGGTIGGNVAINSADATISGGNLGTVTAFPGSIVNFSGSVDAARLTAQGGSEVNISGGQFGRQFGAQSGSTVLISGGSFGPVFRANSGSSVAFVGSEFRLNDLPYVANSITISPDDVFTGTFANGSPFLFAGSQDTLVSVTLNTSSLPPLDATPILIDSPGVQPPSGLRSSQVLTLRDGGLLPEAFAAIGATLHMEGGATGQYFEMAGSILNMSGGSLGEASSAFAGSTLHMSGGNIGERFDAFAGSTVHVSGGSIGSDFTAHEGSVMHVTGGNIGNGFEAKAGSVTSISGGSIGSRFLASGGDVTISGGFLGDQFQVTPNSTVELIGIEFYLDGVLLDLPSNLPTLVSTRGPTSVLSGRLADGSLFDLDLNPSSQSQGDYVASSAQLLVILVPEPSSTTFILIAWSAVCVRKRTRQQYPW
jgi:hypothetical protein